MRFKYSLILIIFVHFGFSQYNFVSNGDFEYFTSPPSTCGGSIAGAGKQSSIQNYWLPCWPWNVPSLDQISTAWPFNSVGSSDYHCTEGIKGPFLGYTNTFEYIVAPLKKNLEIDKYYYVEFYFKDLYYAEAGIKFFHSRPKQKGTEEYIENDGAADVNENGYINSTIPFGPGHGVWKKVIKYYKATSNFSWIALGIFNGKSGSLYIDGIRIIEVGSSDCPEWNVLQNISFTDDVDIMYRSSYVTAAGSNVKTIDDAQGIVSVAAQSTVTLKSARSVEMEDGFIVPEGGTLHAYIAPCDADCFPPTANAGPDYSICQEQSVNIGIPTLSTPELNYSWSADPVSAMAYLSCNNCPNPVINIPMGAAFGKIKYTLTVTNACGQTATDDVYIIYDLKWQQFSASINAYNINYGDYINFDITCDYHTENIFIEVYKNSDNSLVYSKNLRYGDDFLAIPFHWQIDQYLTNCEDYTLKIYSKNFCNPTLSSVQTIPWIRDRNIVVAAWPNVVTPPNPPNNQLCYNVTGAENYVIEIKMSDGTTIYSGSGSMTSGLNCIWDGSCNGSQTNCSSAPDGTYFVTLTFSNCSKQVNHGYFINLFRASHKLFPQDTVTNGNIAVDKINQTKNNDNNINDVAIIPNPNNGLFKVILSDVFLSDCTIEIHNNLSELLFQDSLQNTKEKEFDFSNLARGIYQLKISNKESTYFTKIIIQ